MVSNLPLTPSLTRGGEKLKYNVRIEIDQSGKVEDTSRITVVAYSAENNTEKSILISAKNKRKLQEYFRKTGESRLYIYYIFSILLFILTKEVITEDLVIVDLEYPGKEKLITELLKEIRESYDLKKINCRFEKIGNKPRAHYAAYNVFKRKKKPTLVVEISDIFKILKKTDGRLRGCIATLVGARPRSFNKYYSKKRGINK